MIFLSESESVPVLLSFVYIRLALGDPVTRCGMTRDFLFFLSKRVRQRCGVYGFQIYDPMGETRTL